MRIVLTLVISILLALPVAAERYALVLGNGDYQDAPALRNAVNDANDMAFRLQSMGFKVSLGVDLTRRDTLILVQDFVSQLKRTDTALFYFAGHATQIGSQNYIMPRDAKAGSETALIDSSISLQSILASLETSVRTRLVILDACRDNPFIGEETLTRSASSSRGLFKMNAGVGSFIAFSTAPGTVAADGAGRNSPFTAALLRHMGRPGDDIHALMRRVRADVMTASGNHQIPWENSALIDEVFLTSDAVYRLQSGTDASTNARASDVVTGKANQPFYDTFKATHRVAGLDPNGDGFLALRTGPTSGTPMITMMTEGTPLRSLRRSGQWLQVETPEGLSGWAHGNWIREAPQTEGRTGAGITEPDTATSRAQTCDALWYQRNAIFAARRYCFQSPRGQAAFSNANCIPGMSAADAPLTAQERAQVQAYRDQERALGCN